VQIDLENEGYEVQSVILPACAKNAPHRRDRIWFIAYRNDLGYKRPQGTYRREEYKPNNGEGIRIKPVTNGAESNVTNPSDKRYTPRGTSKKTKGNGSGNNVEPKEREFKAERTDGLHGFQSNAMHSNGTSEPRKYIRQKKQGQFDGPDSRNGIIDWSNFPTKPPICGGNDGIPRELDSITFPKWRNESIKAYGNAIVPQVAFEIFKTIEKYKACYSEK